MPADPRNKPFDKDTLTPSPDQSSPPSSSDEGTATTAFMGSGFEISPPLLPQAGEMVAHYLVLERLGFGGMGVILKAQDAKLNRSVALKFLAPQLSRDPAALQRFYREAQAASALNHPNICTIHDVAEQGPYHFIVMELLEGTTMREHIGSRPLPRDQCMNFTLAIADALEAAHSQGILHRDIKPSNIFVTTAGVVKVLDFGLAKLLPRPLTETEPSGNPLTHAGSAMGTISYMSPEQARGEALDVRSDIFSFGAVLYEMSTGALPFRGQTSALVFDAILHHRPPHPMSVNPDFPAGLERIINRALEKRRAERYQSISEMKADLRKLKERMDSGLVSAATALAQAEQERKRKRRRMQALGAVLLVLVLAEVLVFELLPLYRPSWQATVASTDAATYDRYLKGIEDAATADQALGLVTALSKLGREEQAYQALQGFLQAHPGATEARIRYASWLVGKKRLDEATAQYEAVLKANPADVETEITIARLNSWQKKYAEALVGYDRILRQDPDHYDARVGKAFTLLWMGRRNEARPLLESALREHPDDTEVGAALRTFNAEPSR
ncbi:MAG TPA: serine/threonine-protein kinase [Terriglobales bacterium]|nr:serine/threonine-protein kinase [Terriglobales bacterium]